MKIASFNVNSVRMRLPVLVEWLDKNKPDVLALQETKVQDHEFPARSFAQIGYNCVFSGQKSYNGVAILSPHEIENVESGLPDEPRDESRLIKAEVQGVTIVNTYVPQGVSPDSEYFGYKLEWFRRLREYFQTRFNPSQPILWAGDLNIAPEPIDVYDPKALLGHVCFHPQVQEALREVMAWAPPRRSSSVSPQTLSERGASDSPLAMQEAAPERSWGFTDLFRLHHPEPGQYTFWDYRVLNALKRNMGWRLDHLMATPPLRDRCRACTIDVEPRMAAKPSDHTPIIAEFADA